MDSLSIQLDMTMWIAIDMPDRTPVKVGEAYKGPAIIEDELESLRRTT